VARVLWRDAQGKEGSIDLGAGETRIGRSMDCGIRTDDAMVSRHHARILWGGGGYVLEDLGSANGVYYQEQRVQSHLLKHGDAVRCGSLWLRFIDTGQLEQQPMQQPPAQQPPMQQGGGGMGGGGMGFDPMNPAMNQGGGYGQQGGFPPPQAPPPAAPPPQAPPPAPPMGGMGMGNQGGGVPMSMPQMGSGPAAAPSGEAEEEIRRLRRRLEQLQAELRVYRSGKMGAEKARKLEDMENDYTALEEDRDRLKAQVAELENRIAAEGGNVKVQRAGAIRDKAAETVTALNDLLSSLRINVMAAEGEFDQFANQLPRASFELIREAMRSSAGDVETARELLRQLREVAG
jgi:polyhydroxyalkanoate synthesis regulator phasin